MFVDNNYLTYLPQTFQSFLDQITITTADNVVSLYGNPLNCALLKQHLWLLTNKSKYQQQIWGAKCTNGEYLFDIELYQGKCRFHLNESVLECNNIRGNDFDIRQEIVYLQQIMDIQLNAFELFAMDNCNVIEIPANALNSVPVSQVQLNNLAALTRIDRNAFISGSLYSLTIAGTNQLSFSNTVLTLVNSLYNLQWLSLSLGNGEQILPKNAFSPQLNRLQWIEFTPINYRILTIGENVIGQLDSLVYFSLSGIAIGEMAANAFYYPHVSTEALRVNLSNCSLDETKLQNRPFEQILNRPISLDLSEYAIL